MPEFLNFITYSPYLSIIVVLILTGCGLPIPEEVPIIAAGVAASVGSIDTRWAFLACLVGAVMGDCVVYAIGYHFGHNLAKKHPFFARLLHADREEAIEKMLDKHGLKVLFLARFMVGIRAPVYLTAGILRMPFRRFLLVDAFCATVVVSVCFWLSWMYGERIGKWIRNTEIALTSVLGAAAVIVVCVLYIRHRRKLAAAKAAAENDAADDEASAAEADDTSAKTESVR